MGRGELRFPHYFLRSFTEGRMAGVNHAPRITYFRIACLNPSEKRTLKLAETTPLVNLH
jgi:hypothetical protein